MTVKELASVIKCTRIKLISARYGKVLCHRYVAEKHQNLADREVLSVWAEIRADNTAYDSLAKPIICAYIPENRR